MIQLYIPELLDCYHSPWRKSVKPARLAVNSAFHYDIDEKLLYLF